MYLHPDVEAQRVRAMLEAKRALDAATVAHTSAVHEYRRLQTALTGAFPASVPPGPYVCGDVFIAPRPNYHELDASDMRFTYTQATRIKTSE